MLPRSQKLSIKQFNAVLEKGKIAHSRFFLLRYNVGNPDTRISAVVPKKIGKTAVARNSARRIMYSAVKPIFSKLVSGTHMILFSKLPIKKSEIAGLTSEINTLFVNSGLLV